MIKLIYDLEANLWICGSEDGGIILATGEFCEDAISDVWSTSLRKITLPDDINHYHIPITPEGSFLSADRSQVPHTAPEFDSECITINKFVVGGYTIRAGFGPKTKTWVVSDSFVKAPARSVADVAAGIEW